MKVVVLNTQDGTSRQCEESEITQEDLAGVDNAEVDVIRWNEQSKQYERAAISVDNENYEVSEWNAL